MYQLFKVITLSGFICTVKPVLTAISEQRPPVNNRQTKFCQANLIPILIENVYRATTYAQRPRFGGL